MSLQPRQLSKAILCIAVASKNYPRIMPAFQEISAFQQAKLFAWKVVTLARMITNLLITVTFTSALFLALFHDLFKSFGIEKSRKTCSIDLSILTSLPILLQSVSSFSPSSLLIIFLLTLVKNHILDANPAALVGFLGRTPQSLTLLFHPLFILKIWV